MNNSEAICIRVIPKNGTAFGLKLSFKEKIHVDYDKIREEVPAQVLGQIIMQGTSDYEDATYEYISEELHDKIFVNTEELSWEEHNEN